MAMIDYGAVVIKNGKVMNNSLFSDMEESVGWSDEEEVYFNPELKKWYSCIYLKGNYFAYIGDADFTIGFYKDQARVSWKGNDTQFVAELVCNGWKSHNFTFKGVQFNLKQICPRVYLCTLIYKGNRYNVIFGYGIDPDFRVWNRVKVRYLGKKNAKKVDNVLYRFIRGDDK